MVLIEDTVVADRSGLIVDACLENGSDIESIMVFEPKLDDEQIGHGISFGKVRSEAMNVLRFLM